MLADQAWLDPDLDASNGVLMHKEKDMLRLDAMIMMCQLSVRQLLEVWGLQKHEKLNLLNFKMIEIKNLAIGDGLGVPKLFYVLCMRPLTCFMDNAHLDYDARMGVLDVVFRISMRYMVWRCHTGHSSNRCLLG